MWRKSKIQIYTASMDYSFYDFLMLVGSLGLFLFGMKMMSEGLQKAASKKLKEFLSAMTLHRYAGVLMGMLVTAIIQSSSATTVMVVSFVNAGLISLVQSISVIMGANIGTTVTAWIISVFGFNFNIAELSIPLIGIGIIPLLFSKKNNHKNIGEFIIGFALLFMGLSYLKDSVPDLQNNPEALEFISKFTQKGYGSVLIFLLFGTLLTIVIQSSSATMAVTLIMCAKGWISFEMGAAMVLGENIGTTVTANLAAISTNVSGKRAALAHTTFNVIGVIWMLIVFFPFVGMIQKIIVNVTGVDPKQLDVFTAGLDPGVLKLISDPGITLDDPQLISLRSQLVSLQASTSYALSLFHTMFNLINTGLLIWFTGTIAKIVTKIIPSKKTDEEFQLRYISTNLLSASELAIPEAKKEIDDYITRTRRMFDMVRDLYYEKQESNFEKIYARILKYESISDRVELEIATFLNNVSEGRLSDKSKHQIRQMIRMTSEIESIADSCHNIANTIKRRRDAKVVLTDEMTEHVEIMSGLVYKQLEDMANLILKNSHDTAELLKIRDAEIEINKYRNQLYQENDLDLEAKKYTYQEALYYIDIVRECERLGDYIVNVVEAYTGGSKLFAHI